MEIPVNIIQLDLGQGWLPHYASLQFAWCMSNVKIKLKNKCDQTQFVCTKFLARQRTFKTLYNYCRLETVEMHWNEERAQHCPYPVYVLKIALLLPGESMTALKRFQFDMASDDQAANVKLGKPLPIGQLARTVIPMFIDVMYQKAVRCVHALSTWPFLSMSSFFLHLPSCFIRLVSHFAAPAWILTMPNVIYSLIGDFLKAVWNISLCC